MKKFAVFTLVITLFFGNLTPLFSQQTQPTPYQKKLLELSKKYHQIFYGYKMTMTEAEFFEMLANDEEIMSTIFAMGIITYAMYNPEEQVKKTIDRMEKEFTDAKRLKNARDFKLDKDRKLRIEKEKRERKLRMEREEEEHKKYLEKKNQFLEYYGTDLGAIAWMTKVQFEKWLIKGEFEKEFDYAKRLETLSRTVFDSICYDNFFIHVNNFELLSHREISYYNAENESF